MAATDAITSSSSASTTSTKPSAFSELNSEQFVKIMFAELANQDPLKPNDSNQLMQQMANLRSIQADIDLTTKLKQLVTENQLASAGNLMGSAISGLNDHNTRVQGYVVSVSRTADGPILNLDTGDRVALNNVDEVVDPRLLQNPTNPPTNPTTNPTSNPASYPGTGTPTAPTPTGPEHPFGGG